MHSVSAEATVLRARMLTAVESESGRQRQDPEPFYSCDAGDTLSHERFDAQCWTPEHPPQYKALGRFTNLD